MPHSFSPQTNLSIPSALMKIQGVSPLDSSDALLFREHFTRDEPCYANSWLYLLRSTRRHFGELGFKFLSEQCLIGLGYRSQVIYVSRIYGTIQRSEVVALCTHLKNLTGFPVVLKKMDGKLRDSLLELPRFHSYETESLPEFLEDERYPENQICKDTLFLPNFELKSIAENLIKKSRHFQRIKSDLQTGFNVRMEAGDVLKGLSILANGNQNKYSAYDPIIREVFDSQGKHGTYLTGLFMDGQDIQGLYIGEILSQGIMGLYCALSSRQWNGQTEWMDVRFFEHAFRSGITTILLGGSETRGVDQYVRKLLPTQPPYLMSPLVFV